MFKLINFGYPYFLLLFLIFPILIIWYIYRNNKGIPTLKISTIDTFNNIKSAGKQKLYHILFALRLLALALLIIVLASPQTNLS
ncbi:MAG: BatA domain-containing protein, partial [Bacteroidota bacterium]|nr:BatA domain-containing protein [Bacteroidota bacterium]